MIFITCRKRDILRDFKQKAVGGKTNDRTEWSCISEYKNMVKRFNAPIVKARQKGCVTTFYFVPRNIDQRRRWLTFL